MINAMENHGSEANFYLDLNTGDLVQINLNDLTPQNEYLSQLRRMMERDPNRFLDIERIPSRDSFRLMEDFSNAVQNPQIKGRLLESLKMRKPFRTFKDELCNHPQIREEWFIYHDQEMRTYAEEWLNNLQIEYEAIVSEKAAARAPAVASPKVFFGKFNDFHREFVISNPDTPRPWINYLGNGRLSAFISQRAGGMAFYREPQTRRLTRYNHLATPQDQPGFYLYVKDPQNEVVWNPHWAPACTPVETFSCRHTPGSTTFRGRLFGIVVTVRYFIPPNHDALIWDVQVENQAKVPRSIQICSYTEFSLLEFMRELFWCYLKSHISFTYDADKNWIAYKYNAFEAPFSPAIFFSSTRKAEMFECSRDVFLGNNGSLGHPESLSGRGFTGSQLPGGGHGCGVLGFNLSLAAGATERFSYILGVADDWEKAAALKESLADNDAIDQALESLTDVWQKKLSTLQVISPDPHVDRMINTWNPLNCHVALERTRDISTDHTGVDGQRFRDTMQDALGVSTFDPAFAAERIKMVLSVQHSDGSGCFSFYPYNKQPLTEKPDRCDNTVWPIMTIANLVNETGDLSFFDEVVPYRDGGSSTVYEHVVEGLRYIWSRRGPHGLPTLFDADWNDGLAVFRDPKAESVMLGMQMVYAARLLRGFTERLKKKRDGNWCDKVISELTEICNSDVVWDGAWYRRLLLADGTNIGSSQREQGQIFLEPQVWAVISGVADAQRGRMAMDSVYEKLNTQYGLMILTPPYTGIPNPTDPLTSNAPGNGENGGIFCHAHTWAIIAECILGNGDRALEYYKKILPSAVSEEMGHEHWGREPYVFNSTIAGPARGDDFGKAGISWLTGTASWAYIAATQYIFGLKPTFEGLELKPCMAESWKKVTLSRKFRGSDYRIEIDAEQNKILVNGAPFEGTLIGQ